MLVDSRSPAGSRWQVHAMLPGQAHAMLHAMLPWQQAVQGTLNLPHSGMQ